MNSNKIIIFLVFCSFLSCIKQSPQLPSNKGNVVDENASTLLLINQRLALKEDSILELLALQDKAYTKSDLGFWFKMNQTIGGQPIKDKDTCRFAYNLMLLDGKIVEKAEKQIVIGQKQIVIGLEEAIKLLHKGENATIIIPWYLAFGMNGNDKLVPPYTSIIYQIQVYK